MRLPVGAEIGTYRQSCLLSYSEIGRHYFRGNINQIEINDVFAQTLEAQGFDVASRINTSGARILPKCIDYIREMDAFLQEKIF